MFEMQGVNRLRYSCGQHTRAMTGLYLKPVKVQKPVIPANILFLRPKCKREIANAW